VLILKLRTIRIILKQSDKLLIASAIIAMELVSNPIISLVENKNKLMNNPTALLKFPYDLRVVKLCVSS